jgi:hypothetical protein
MATDRTLFFTWDALHILHLHCELRDRIRVGQKSLIMKFRLRFLFFSESIIFSFLLHKRDISHGLDKVQYYRSNKVQYYRSKTRARETCVANQKYALNNRFLVMEKNMIRPAAKREVENHTTNAGSIPLILSRESPLPYHQKS